MKGTFGTGYLPSSWLKTIDSTDVPLRPPNSGSHVTRASPASNFIACQRFARLEVVAPRDLELRLVLGHLAGDLRRVLLEPGPELLAPRGFLGGVVEVHVGSLRPRPSRGQTPGGAGRGRLVVGRAQRPYDHPAL